ncbi:glycoside hydrolase family 88 protein [Draconibacterium mangrovi]|uniref:glycoside hydrolase family 88 protein n=1 Tax=Draconibacterium mangrovi TaxID=2697469 RepID=UPI0013D5D411|nr:glycoside hydrolase family 88 protein [Draconibacterium mangrovi]
MNKLITLLFLILSLGCSNQQTGEGDRIIKHLESQLDYAVKNAESLATSELISPRTSENGKLKLVKTRDWTSGFFSGNLWMMYKLTGDEKWKETALKFTLPLEQEKWNGNTHDMGFKMYCSFGQAIKYTDNPEYREILIQSAKTLSTRFNPVVGCIRSWDHNSDKWDYPVIIDNMMNLELLLWAAKETGNENFKEIAIKHAETTIKNHFRENYSSYHVIDYNPQTGEVQHKNTHQGYADESAWSRGQAWGLYGFTMLYRETGNNEFLRQAERIADFILSQPGIKQGEIPYWDFDAPGIPDEPLDASAGAIIASALFELSTFSDKQREYVSVARNLLATLSSDKFLAPIGENEGFLLKHSTGHKPHDSEIDEPLVYADYYFLEAIIRNRAIKAKDE